MRSQIFHSPSPSSVGIPTATGQVSPLMRLILTVTTKMSFTTKSSADPWWKRPRSRRLSRSVPTTATIATLCRILAVSPAWKLSFDDCICLFVSFAFIFGILSVFSCLVFTSSASIHGHILPCLSDSDMYIHTSYIHTYIHRWPGMH